MSRVSVDLSAPSPYIESSYWLHRFKRRLTYAWPISVIRAYAKPSKSLSLLEIGTGSGFFLDTAKHAFPGVELTGLEYDERLLAVTCARVPDAYCVQGNAEYFSFAPKVFDVVVSFQVIEHLYEPSAMLRNVRNSMSPDGIFIFTTPNLGGLGSRVMGQKWHGYRDDHVSLKTCEDWTALLTASGFRPIYVGSTFFSGIPWMNRFPLGLLNWFLLVVVRVLPWRLGESYCGVFKKVEG